MAFFQRSNQLDSNTSYSNVKEDTNIVYVLKIKHLDDKYVYKIGVTSRSIADRVVEVTRDYFHKYRFFPWVKPIRFSKARENKFKIEAMLHRYFKRKKYVPATRFDGSDELFKLDIVHGDALVKRAYDDAMDGIDIEDEDVYPDPDILLSIVKILKYKEELEDEDTLSLDIDTLDRLLSYEVDKVRKVNEEWLDGLV